MPWTRRSGRGAPRARSVVAKRLYLPVEPYANDWVEDNLTPIGRLYYSASTTLCCAHSIAEEGLALGAQVGRKEVSESFKRSWISEDPRRQENSV
jgi:hypothetical protein